MRLANKTSVFILENQLETREQLHSILHGYGYEVRAFSHFGDMADEVVVGIIPDVFIISYDLEDGMTGVEAIQSLKLKDSFALIIGIADSADRNVMRELIKIGCHNFALKTEYERIADIIERMMLSRRRPSKARALTARI